MGASAPFLLPGRCQIMAERGKGWWRTEWGGGVMAELGGGESWQNWAILPGFALYSWVIQMFSHFAFDAKLPSCVHPPW